MFIENNCNKCGICLVQCNYSSYSLETAKAEIDNLLKGVNTEILAQCITCSACNEICESNANPFDLINKLQEKYNVLNVPLKTKQEYENLTKVPKKIINREKNGPVISLCSLGDFVPCLFEGEIFNGATLVKGGEYFCHIGFTHLGITLKKEMVEAFINNLSELNSETIIFYHDECYAVATVKAQEFGIGVPFKVVHIYKYLYDYLCNNRPRIKKLNIDIAYQRPCGARYTPEKDTYLDLIFEMIGVNRVKRKYDRKNSLCCGTPLYYRVNKEEIEDLQKKNIKDAKENGAKYMAFSCPICIMNMRNTCSSEGIEPISIIKLCRQSLGENVSRYTI